MAGWKEQNMAGRERQGGTLQPRREQSSLCHYFGGNWGFPRSYSLGSCHSTPLSPHSSPTPWVHILVLPFPGVLRATSEAKLRRGSVSCQQPAETSLAASLQMSTGPRGLPAEPVAGWRVMDGAAWPLITGRGGNRWPQCGHGDSL